MQDEVNQKVVTLCIKRRKDFCPYLKRCPGKAAQKNGADGTAEAPGTKNKQERKRGGFLPWETEYGKADEAELSAYKYRSDRWKYQVF